MTQQLLAFSRKQVAQMRPLNLNDVVREAEGLLNRVIGEDVIWRRVAPEDARPCPRRCPS